MPNYKVVDADKLDADLKYVADKIRAKGGTTDEMAFPLGYGDAVDAIQSGGGSSGENKLAKVVDRTATEITAKDLEGCTQISAYAFQQYSTLKSIEIPNSVTSIGSYAFSYCTGLTSVIIPDSVTSISNAAFMVCSELTSRIAIPNKITSIKDQTFAGCARLKSITIPNSVTNIGSSAFYGCTSMQYYDFTACTSVPTLANATVFSGIPSTCEIRVPMALVDEWKAATNWSTYASQIVGVDTGDTRPIKTFTISGVPTDGHYEEYGFSSTFEFREGMTWGEWRNSIYNKDQYWSYTNQWGYYSAISHDYYDSDTHAVVDANGNLLADDDVILEGSGNYEVLSYFDNYGAEEDEPEPTDNIEFFIQSANAHRFNVPAGTKWIDVPSIIGTSIFKIEEDILWFCEDDSWYEVVDVPFESFHNEIIDGEMYYTSNY